jgi:hypothetical protein
MKASGFEPGYRVIADWAGLVNTDIARMRIIAEHAQIKAD